MPECDRALFKKWALCPWGLVCHESWINETTTVLPLTIHSATQQRRGRRTKEKGKMEERKKKKEKRGNGVGRQAETENWRGDEGSGGEEEK